MLDNDTRTLIIGSVAEIDLKQIAISRKRTAAQRVSKALSMMKVAEQVATYRFLKRHLSLSVYEAQQVLRERASQSDFDLVLHVPLNEKMMKLSQELEKRAMLVPCDIILDIYIQNRADTPVNAIHLHKGYKWMRSWIALTSNLGLPG